MGRLSFPYLSNRSLRPVLQNNEMTRLASARLGMIYLSKIMYKIALRPSYITVRPLCHSRTSSTTPRTPLRLLAFVFHFIFCIRYIRSHRLPPVGTRLRIVFHSSTKPKISMTTLRYASMVWLYCKSNKP